MPRKPSRPEQTIAAVARAVEAFRRGTPVLIKGPGGDGLARAVETLGASEKPEGLLLLTHARAATLKMRLYTKDVVALKPRKGATAAELRVLADPTADLAHPLMGPFVAGRGKLPASFAASVKLAKLAGLLPATMVTRVKKTAKAQVSVSAEDVFSYEAAAVQSLAIVTAAPVPLEGAKHTQLIAFRSGDAGPEHYAIVINAPRQDRAVLTRLHSECFTGDLLGSLKCDCGAQLRGAIAALEKAGGGILLYLAQEGRGIGLVNKLRAYRLQDQGFDTMQANARLGFEDDERLYGVAARMLTLLGYSRVRLLTNNPAKVAGLKAAGIKVVARIAHKFPGNAHNRFYLATKAKKAGHLI
ncbi:MAG TPA: GTP cyclohydrolase II RibA [Rhizomicrobium sp.]